MTFCKNNNLFSNLPCPDWMQKPLQISKGGFRKRDGHFSCGAFQSRGIIYGNLLELDTRRCILGRYKT